MHYSRKPSERTWHLGCFPQTEWRVERTIINTAERGIFWFWLCGLLLVQHMDLLAPQHVGYLFPDQGLSQYSLVGGFLTTGLQGMSQGVLYFNKSQ